MSYPWLEHVEAEFAARFSGKRLAHAFLLAGPEGTGKSELARRLMSGLLCKENVFPGCGDCRSCSLLESGAHPDGHTVTFEPHPKKEGLRTELVIEQVRRLTESLQLTNTISSRKVALIVPAEAMNRNAANALLKTLEEPPGDAVLLLVAHRPSRLPATIRSRCQVLNVRLPDREVARHWLEETAAAGADEAAAALEATAGSPLAALQMLQDGSIDTYRQALETLEGLRGGRCETAQALADLQDIEPDRLWTWFSLRAASETRAGLDRPRLARALAELQIEADRNRRLLSTPVRKDLLLRDWLIQWSSLNA